MSHRLTLHAYNGMSTPGVDDDDMQTCRKQAANFIRYHRNKLEYPVVILAKGTRWELQSDPDGASMVGDHEGILSIEKIPVNECNECGCDLPVGERGTCEDCCDAEISRDECEGCGHEFDPSDLVDGLCADCEEDEEDEMTEEEERAEIGRIIAHDLAALDYRMTHRDEYEGDADDE